MDISKFPLERLTYFVAGTIPGLVALLIFYLAHPESLGWFFILGFLGYRTKLALLLLVAFVAGNTMTTCLSASLGVAGGVIGHRMSLRPYVPPASQAIAPWRDPRWRAVLKMNLGEHAPPDTLPIPPGILAQRKQIIGMMPKERQQTEASGLELERIRAEMDDQKWSEWYDHYHRIVVDPNKRDFESYVRTGLNFNLETAALYVLIWVPFVPAVRRWWCIFPACVWLLVAVAEVYTAWRRYIDQWSTLSDQIQYLSRPAQRTALGPEPGAAR